MQSVEMVSAETTLSERQQLEQHQQLEQQKQHLLEQQQLHIQQQQQLILEHHQQQQLKQQQEQEQEHLRQSQAQAQALAQSTPQPQVQVQAPALVPIQEQPQAQASIQEEVPASALDPQVQTQQASAQRQAEQAQRQAQLEQQQQQQLLQTQQQLLQQRQQVQRVPQQQATRRKFNLDDFRIHRTLGTGSFGRVHLAQSRFNSRFYAMKVLKKTEVVRLKQVEHTNNEKMILERVEHPFLINMWGTFQDVRNLYMVTDYVVGGELFSVLRKSQRFPEHVARFYTCEVLLALEYLHSHAVIYRDLKPENLLLDSMGHIKIIDFGFAKHVPQNMTWTLCGTPDYLAPEIIQSKGYGKAVDWWSMGVLMFEMCAGFPPFYDEDHIKLYGKIMAGKFRYQPHFSPAFKDILKRLLTADLTKRYGNLRGGATDIKNHVWFEGINWDMVYSRQIEAPYRPTILGEGDSSNFDDYPEDGETYGVYPAGETDELGMYFPDF
ncbi:camp-dependent protein kinase catalytic subunit [Dissophora globulifera]|nr:camp-dependent protein kinase catalytic subunit [Dissophora globulifera]